MWCKKFDIRFVTMGTNPIKEMEQADNLKLQRGPWKENYKEIREDLDELKKSKIHRDANNKKGKQLSEGKDTHQCKTMA